MNRKYEEYVPPTKSEALQNLTGGYEESEKQPKELQSLNEMDSVKQRLDNGENVSHMELLSYGFYQLNKSKSESSEEGEK
ncbi:hypothetical protein [Peribacillus frigoritolerans]|uniref:Uncharacterized protein n=1 Tax=Peribacillus frigoritolerans TaxID=450367 RepID=A0AAJ1QKA9_9BACI|nr:hypothetical protein [Peribacillus frigoritolerans]MDM5283111.1 hypothetical protein [Peribacillus frigoritolerans]